MKCCNDCKNHSGDSCRVGPQAVDRHGDESVQDWLAFPDDANSCSLFNPKGTEASLKVKEIDTDSIRIKLLAAHKWVVRITGKSEFYDNEAIARQRFDEVAPGIDGGDFLALIDPTGKIIDHRGSDEVENFEDSLPGVPPYLDDLAQNLQGNPEKMIRNMYTTVSPEEAEKNRAKLIELKEDLRVLAPNDPKRTEVELEISKLQNISASMLAAAEVEVKMTDGERAAKEARDAQRAKNLADYQRRLEEAKAASEAADARKQADAKAKAEHIQNKAKDFENKLEDKK